MEQHESLDAMLFPFAVLALMMISIPPRDTSPHQDSASTAPSGTPPPAQPPPPPLQTRGTQSHSSSTPLKWSILTPERGTYSTVDGATSLTR